MYEVDIMSPDWPTSHKSFINFKSKIVVYDLNRIIESPSSSNGERI